MEVAVRQPACLSGATGFVNSSNNTRRRRPSSVSIPETSFGGTPIRVWRSSNVLGAASGFRDSGHLDFYCNANSKKKDGALVTRCDKDIKKETKKKLKLLEGLSKDLSKLTQMDTDLLGAQGELVSEAAQVLMKHLEQLQAEEKERMRKEKDDKTLLKSLACESESSSESSDIDDECCYRVIDMSSFRNRATSVADIAVDALPTEEASSAPSLQAHESMAVQSLKNHAGFTCMSEMDTGAGSGEKSLKRIEVCTGNKCKKSGGAALLEEFGKAVGGSGTVVGCKCMGKCRDGPNVRLFNSLDEGADVSVTTPPNPLCLGVALEDVGVIVANFFAHELGLSPSV